MSKNNKTHQSKKVYPIKGIQPYILLWIIFSLSTGKLIAQSPDSLFPKKFRFDVSGGFYYQVQIHKSDGSNPEIKMPAYLSPRRPQEPELANLWGLNNNRSTDNPLGHGASYIRFHSWYNITEGLDIYGSLEVNNGGFSWGPYNTFNITMLPRYYVNYAKIFCIKNVKYPLTLHAKIGYFENYKSYEGLTIYNLDVQGMEAALQWGRLKFSAMKIADLQGMVGLNIDGTTNFQLSVIDIPLQTWKAELKAGVQKLEGSSNSGRLIDFVSFSAVLHKKQSRLYTEAGYRFSGPGFSNSLNSAFVAGFNKTIESRFVSSAFTAEYRYYGGGFNYGFRKENHTHYRSTDKPAGSNFRGDQIYPISFVDRPFSQWAVFTEYDKQWVNGFTCNARLDFKLSRHLKWTAEADINTIWAQGEETFTYPFYKTGIKLETIRNTYLSATITNKTMNLDKHYTTWYLLKQPVFQFELRRDIKL